MLKRIEPKSLSIIQNEWDSICGNRQAVIDSGNDISLLAVTAPCIIEELGSDRVESILDVGCGTGYLTSLLATHTSRCVGIDASRNSITVAKSRYEKSGAKFEVSSIGDFKSNLQFDICVANMVFSSDPDWLNSIRAIHTLLCEDGKLLVMLPHPCNWPKYWGFQNSTWFNCNEEVYIEHDFTVSLAKSLGKATYIHRPLSLYISKICSVGFALEKMKEPYPVGELPDKYNYDFPRFLFMKFIKR